MLGITTNSLPGYAVTSRGAFPAAIDDPNLQLASWDRLDRYEIGLQPSRAGRGPRSSV